MNRLRTVFEVARWEFLRFFKPKEQIKSLILVVFIAFFGYGLMEIIGSSISNEAVSRELEKGSPDLDRVRLGVLNPNLLSFDFSDSRFQEISLDAESVDELEAIVKSGQVDGCLRLESWNDAGLIVTDSAGVSAWRNDLQRLLTQARLKFHLQELEAVPSDIESVLSPFELDIRSVTSQGTARPKFWVFFFVFLSLMGVFVGNAHLFVGITGEKQLRVTEQLVSILTPQTWMDGKIIGLCTFSMITVLNGILGISLFFAILYIADLRLPSFAALPSIDASTLVILLGLAALSFAFWIAFFATVAATISNPHTSARSGFLFLPIPLISVAFVAVQFPDASIISVLQFFPGIGPPVLSARVVMTDVAAWEGIVATSITVVATILLRRAAGKIFGLCMLLYGKEPSLREALKWLRQA